MGQQVKFLGTSSPRPGIVRFELNRTITGMGHEYYVKDDEITGDRASDRLAGRLLDTGKLRTVHIYGSVVTAELVDAQTASLNDDTEQALKEAISSLYTHYLPDVAVPSDEEVSASTAV
ncbi:MAG: hypothetical protein OXI96_05095 [Acidimicrobiaceae bacterium]|nr:hypothetical protein [Acidimicrobiaceae bacterium]